MKKCLDGCVALGETLENTKPKERQIRKDRDER